MRPWISLLLFGAGLTAAVAAPAMADTMTARSPVGVVHQSRVRAPLHRDHLFHRHVGLLHRHLGLGPFLAGAPLVFPGGYYASDLAAGAAAPIILSEPQVIAAPPPQLPPVEQRPSVETTAAGVVIVRGPGSHHIGY